MHFIKPVAASAAEVSLRAISHSAQIIPVIYHILSTLGHRQPAYALFFDNSTVVSIVHNTIKKEHLCAINMYSLWTK